MKLFLGTFLFALSAWAANYKVISKPVGSVLIPFVKNADIEEKTYQQKASFAEIERLAPLKSEQLTSLRPDDLRGLSMEEFNQLYARVASGPTPLGDYNGYVMQKSPFYVAFKKRLLRQASVFITFTALAKQACGKEADDCLFEFIWKGKRFWPKDSMDQVMAKTIFNPISSGLKLSLIPPLAQSKAFNDVLNFAEGLVDQANLTLFPMQTYCGISQVDARKESIITDGAFADDFKFPSYIPERDDVISRKGLNITEEYRMLRPGLYLGKVYSNKVFLFNTVLEKTGVLSNPDLKSACADTTKGIEN